MNNEERDQMLIETHRDVRWIKRWTVEHKSIHSRYLLMVWAAIIAALVALIK